MRHIAIVLALLAQDPRSLAQDIPELDALKAKYETARCQLDVACLTAYTNNLATLANECKQAGDVDGYLAVQGEQRRLLAGGDIESALTNGNAAVCKAAAQITEEKKAKTAALMGNYAARLSLLIKDLMRADRVSEAKVTKTTMDAVAAQITSLTPQSQLTATGRQPPDGKAAKDRNLPVVDRIVVWNSHNAAVRNFGVRRFNLILRSGQQETWRRNDVDIEWQPDKDVSKEVMIPRKAADAIRIEVTEHAAPGASLSEVEVFSRGTNIARNCRATASSTWRNKPLVGPDKLTDGVTSSDQGAWVSWDEPRAWIEIQLVPARDTQR